MSFCCSPVYTYSLIDEWTLHYLQIHACLTYIIHPVNLVVEVFIKMRWLLCVSIVICWSTYGKANEDWWKHASFYQVYPRSFKDSDGDGIGDIKGITSKISHFKDAGVDAIWLSPIYKSPQVDQGYDISDFKAIDEQYGTMSDFKELLDEAHELGIKVIMDFVPNHSSDQHEWFIKSENKEDGFEDYYVWRDEPNNWVHLKFR